MDDKAIEFPLCWEVPGYRGILGIGVLVLVLDGFDPSVHYLSREVLKLQQRSSIIHYRPSFIALVTSDSILTRLLNTRLYWVELKSPQVEGMWAS